MSYSSHVLRNGHLNVLRKPSSKALIKHPLAIASVTIASVFGIGSANAAEMLAAVSDLSTLSIDELMNIEVTSVSKRPETFLEAPAAIQIVTNAEIHRSGATNIPEALSLAGNLDVAQAGSDKWIVSARGFSSETGNKLLVMIDGRSIYTPLYSGVIWNRQDYLLEDIDRIEAISGPGGTLWGANAVNGVVNIITKSAKDTQGLYLEGSTGINPRSSFAGRYGGMLAPDVYFRVYGKYANRKNGVLTNGIPAGDAWNAVQGGFRADILGHDRDAYTIQGDIYKLKAGGTATTGGNALARWSRAISETSNMELQVYYDRTDYTAGPFKDSLDTIDVDFQHHFQMGADHRLVWGFGYRFTHDAVVNARSLSFFPPVLDQSLYSAFVQDEISLTDDFRVTFGTKIEHNAYTGIEYEPNIRFQWNVAGNHSLWGAISRAVRMPSRIDRDASTRHPVVDIEILRGDPAFRSETVVAYEVGYRTQLTTNIGGSLSLFYNKYDDIRSASLSPPAPITNLPFPVFFENNVEGRAYGLEIGADVNITEWWHLSGNYRFLKNEMRVEPGKTDINKALNETNDPKHQLYLRSSLDLPHDLTLDTNLRWIGNRTINNNGVAGIVPDYAELDVRIGWDIPGPLEFSVAGRNLLHDHHPEFGRPGPNRGEIERSVYATISFRM